jgi:hypothetical protein
MTRLAAAWRALEREQRLTALAALGLFVSMFLPWYSKTETRVIGAALSPAQIRLTAFQDFSFVEAAVLLVCAGVLALLFARAERRRFQLPGGDGLIVMIAGGWTAVLIFYRLLDKPGVQSNHASAATATVGVEWGIFIALLVALGLLSTGVRLRALQRERQPVPDHDRREARRYPFAREREPYATATVVQARPGRQTAASSRGERISGGRRTRYPPAPGEQMPPEDSRSDSA